MLIMMIIITSLISSPWTVSPLYIITFTPEHQICSSPHSLSLAYILLCLGWPLPLHSLSTFALSLTPSHFPSHWHITEQTNTAIRRTDSELVSVSVYYVPSLMLLFSCELKFSNSAFFFFFHRLSLPSSSRARQEMNTVSQTVRQ